MTQKRGPTPCAAHPRSRGEHFLPKGTMSATFGSSPLARGTLRAAIAHSAPFRLIPARAGNTYVQTGVRTDSAAHPRSRGEHSIETLADSLRYGSSPLARGTQTSLSTALYAIRLIPARAGNTMIWMFPTVKMSAHPRSRGEHSVSSVQRIM